MKIVSVLIIFAFLATSCKDSDENMYTGRSLQYPLYSATEGGFDGLVTFTERTDGSVDIAVKLSELSGKGNLPVHLHIGDLSVVDAPQAALLTDYDISRGESLTNVGQLADETPLTLDRIKTYNGSIKVHLGNSGPDKNIIVAAGNIGSNLSKGFNMQSIAVCGDGLVN